MSIKLQWNTDYKKVCEMENEIKNDWYWKFQSKTYKKLLLIDIAMLKTKLSVTSKQHDCLQSIVEKS